MYKVSIQNWDNDKELEIELPIIPRIGDWIDIGNDEFSDIGETQFSVIHVTIYTDHRGINIGVSEKDYNIYLVDSFGKYFHNL
jgi:hypothetical protein